MGRVPNGVERNLYLPAVKSRGGGSRNGAAMPLPSPASPWHWEHHLAYTFAPAARWASVPRSPAAAAARAAGAGTASHAATASSTAVHPVAPRRTATPPPPTRCARAGSAR